jgi:hypothetical protein
MQLCIVELNGEIITSCIKKDIDRNSSATSAVTCRPKVISVMITDNPTEIRIKYSRIQRALALHEHV